VTAQYRSHRLARVFAAVASAAALAAPTAVARPIDDPLLPARPPVVVEPEQTAVVQKIDDGFDWGSAAIGAGGAGALVVIVALGGVAYTTRHRVGVAR
jgi:hypothetical protein